MHESALDLLTYMSCQVMSHMGKRLDWTDPSFQSLVVTEQQLIGQGTGRGGDNNYAVLDQLLGTGCQVNTRASCCPMPCLQDLVHVHCRGRCPVCDRFMQ